METGCCERFDPAPWTDAVVHWQDRPFIYADVPALMHWPLGVGRVASRASAAIEAAGMKAESQLMLADETSPWRTRLYIATAGPVPGWRLERMTGTFFTKVFDGPFKDVAKWIGETKQDAARRGHVVDHVFEAWTTCPKCAKAYGHNYVVVLARLAEAEARDAA